MFFNPAGRHPGSPAADSLKRRLFAAAMGGLGTYATGNQQLGQQIFSRLAPNSMSILDRLLGQAKEEEEEPQAGAGTPFF